MFGVGGGLVVDNHLDSFGGGVAHNAIEIIVRIGLCEVETCAVFHPIAIPSEIPAFHEHSSDAIFCGKVNVFFCEFRIRSVSRAVVPSV